MTCEELCRELSAPADAPPGALLAGWNRRRAELAALLADEGQAKPVKLRYRQELRRLDGANGLIEQLQIGAEIDRYLAELDAEGAKPVAGRAVLRLCSEKAHPLLQRLPEGSIRFGCEKRLAAARERLDTPPTPERAAPASPPPAAPASVPTIAPPAHTTLELTEENGAVLRFIARPSFTLGRARGADLVTHFLPETDDNRQKTSTISRINTTLSLRGGLIWIQDGQIGEDALPRSSKNGTLVDDRRVTAAVPMDFAPERRLKLGQFRFEVRAQHLTPDNGGAAKTLRPESRSGCIRFLPISSSQPDARVVWLLAEASLGSSAGAAVRLSAALPPIAASVHHRHGGFWLETNSAADNAILLDGNRRPAGNVDSLENARALQIGPHRYHLKLF